MNALGEVGKKMRSAVKAKLLELGTGQQSGYIDDELPDYVMIMVANKRDKDQMKKELQLFLGSHTETFVNWLHQVLQKLQEVTLPNNLTSKAKQKTAESTKKDKKKDKKKKEPSITDVIAVELMEKAKKTLSDDPKLKDESATPEKSPEPATPPAKTTSNDELNIPTISEIKTSGNLHHKELSQLAELQSRIYEAKKKLKDLDSDDEEIRQNLDTKPAAKPAAAVAPIKPSSVISLSAIKKAEKEIYIAPSFRKLIEKQKEQNERQGSRRDEKSDSRSRSRPDRQRRSRTRSRSRSRSRERRARRGRSRSPKKPEKPRVSVHQRIGLRSIAKSPPPPPPIKRELTTKAKTRPILSSAITARAGKNLLLRAVAEAQKSTTSQLKHEVRAKRDNIVVQVGSRQERDARRIRLDEEYVPESVTPHKETPYRPSKSATAHDETDDGDVIYLNNVDEVDLDELEKDEVVRKSPQFVVTMDGVNNKYNRESHSPTPPPVIKRRKIHERIGIRAGSELERLKSRQTLKRKSDPVVIVQEETVQEEEEEEHESLKAYNRAKRSKVSPIKFDLTDEEENNCSDDSPRKRNVSEKSGDETNEEEQKRIRLESSRSFDHVPPLLSSVAVIAPEQPKPKSKERCKFYPLCSNTNCAFYHPTLPCKKFPACPFGDTCAFIHPKCMYDSSCTRNNCNFSHTQVAGAVNPTLSSSIVPAQSFKSVTPIAAVCKFHPSCSNTNCAFLHPKPCMYGKNCLNKYECNFYHFEAPSKSKFKWISPI